MVYGFWWFLVVFGGLWMVFGGLWIIFGGLSWFFGGLPWFFWWLTMVFGGLPLFLVVYGCLWEFMDVCGGLIMVSHGWWWCTIVFSSVFLLIFLIPTRRTWDFFHNIKCGGHHENPRVNRVNRLTVGELCPAKNRDTQKVLLTLSLDKFQTSRSPNSFQRFFGRRSISWKIAPNCHLSISSRSFFGRCFVAGKWSQQKHHRCAKMTSLAGGVGKLRPGRPNHDRRADRSCWAASAASRFS